MSFSGASIMPAFGIFSNADFRTYINDTSEYNRVGRLNSITSQKCTITRILPF